MWKNWFLPHVASHAWQHLCDPGSGPVVGADLRTPPEGDEAAAGWHGLPLAIDEQLQPSLQGVLGSTHDIQARAFKSCKASRGSKPSQHASN